MSPKGTDNGSPNSSSPQTCEIAPKMPCTTRSLAACSPLSTTGDNSHGYPPLPLPRELPNGSQKNQPWITRIDPPPWTAQTHLELRHGQRQKRHDAGERTADGGGYGSAAGEWLLSFALGSGPPDFWKDVTTCTALTSSSVAGSARTPGRSHCRWMRCLPAYRCTVGPVAR